MARQSSLNEPPLPLFATGRAVTVGAQVPSYIGDHRARLRERFLTGGADAMPDYELLEMVLFRANARRDMKPVGRALMDRFGSFNRVITAAETELQKVKGVGPSLVAGILYTSAAAEDKRGCGVSGVRLLTTDREVCTSPK